MSIFKGAAVAIITPMTETQEVNYEKLGELIEEQIAGGTDAIVICGTTGEASTLSHEEHLDAIKYTVEKVNHRIPVIADKLPAPTARGQQFLCLRKQKNTAWTDFFSFLRITIKQHRRA